MHKLFSFRCRQFHKQNSVEMDLWLNPVTYSSTTEWICNAKHFHWHVCLWKWEVVAKILHIVLRLSLSISLPLYLSLWTSDHSPPVVPRYQFRGRNRLCPRSRNQFVSAHQVSPWKCQCWENTWYSQNEIMGHHKFCGEALSVSLMFRGSPIDNSW